MKNLLKPIIVLTVIALVCTAALASVNMLTKNIIEKSIQQQAMSIMNELIEDKEGFEPISIDSETLGSFNANALYRSKSGNGYIADVFSSGYNGEINMMVAFTPDLKISGVKVLSHGETKGVGTRVVENEDYLKSFNGKGIDKQEAVDFVSGATVSSKAIINGVNSAANLIVSQKLN